MGFHRQLARFSRRQIAVSLMLICTLLVISGFLYSPWHRHNPTSRQACLFSPVEGCSTLEPSSPIQIQPTVGALWLAPVYAAALPQARLSRPRFGRAPPA